MKKLLLVLSLSASMAAAATVSFGIKDDSDGCTGITDPQNPTNPSACNLYPIAGLEYQQVYGAEAFSAQSNGPFRIDAFSLTGTFIDLAYVDITISFSTTDRAVGGLSSNLADNIGTPLIEFLHFQNPINTGRNSTLSFTATNPYYYYPEFGNLLLDIIVNSFSLGAHPSVHVNEQLDSGIMSRAALMGQIGPPVADFSMTDSEGLVTTFEGDGVPEPSSMLLMAVPALALLAIKRRRSA